MKKLLVVATVLTATFLGIKRYQQHVNKAPNIEY